MRLAALAALTLLGLLGCRPREPELVWSYDPEGYFADDDFTRGSLFTKSHVFIGKLSHTAEQGWLVSLDPATGTQRWEIAPAEWVLHPPDAARPLYVINRSSPEPGTASDPFGSGTYREIHELDPDTGAVIRRVPLKHAPFSPFDTRFVYAGDRVVYISRNELGAIDPTTGETTWTTPARLDTLFAPEVLPDRLVFPGATYRAYALSDGRPLFAIPGACCAALATPDGARLYILLPGDRTGEVDATGTIVRTLPGRPQAVSERFVATSTGDLQVFPHGAAAPIFAYARVSKDDFVSAVALSGSRLFYFRGADRKLWQRDLDAGTSAPLLQIHWKFVLSTDATGTSPAYLGTPPRYVAPNLFIDDWTVRMYRLPSP